MLLGTAPPTIAVTETNCGAFTALGSEIVTVPVYVPAANDAVWSAIATGIQGPFSEQVVVAPTVGASHGTDEDAVRLSVPSPTLPASTVWVAPFDPGTTDTVNAVCVSTSWGAAFAAAAPSRRNNPYFAKEKFSRTT
jgi:hypothetical protein